MVWMATAIVASTLVGAYSANKAAGVQADAANNSAQLQKAMYDQTVANEAPFRQAGVNATDQLQYLLGTGNKNGSSTGGGYGSLLKPFSLNDFHNLSPAYQFQLQQGQQGTLNGDASNAGALSGAAQKDLMSFNQGAANTAFNNAFNQYQTQQGNIYSRLAGLSQTGQAAASNQATGASNFGNSIGNQVSNAGTAQAAGIVGVGNSLSSASSLPWLMNLNSSGGSSTTQANTYQPASNLLGDAGGNYIITGQGNSDRRLKKDIVRVGALQSGLPLYRFRYIADPTTQHIGVMADEVEPLFPDAVITKDDGFQMVDYDRIS